MMWRLEDMNPSALDIPGQHDQALAAVSDTKAAEHACQRVPQRIGVIYRPEQLPGPTRIRRSS